MKIIAMNLFGKKKTSSLSASSAPVGSDPTGIFVLKYFALASSLCNCHKLSTIVFHEMTVGEFYLRLFIFMLTTLSVGLVKYSILRDNFEATGTDGGSR